MRHRRSYHGRPAAVIYISYQFTDEFLDIVAIGCGIDHIAILILDPYGTGAPLPWILRQVVLHHHEMQRLQEALVERGHLWGSGELQDICHRVPIAGDRLLSLLVRIE